MNQEENAATPDARRMAQLNLYFEQAKKFDNTVPNSEARFGQAVDAIHQFAEQSEWFAENTPAHFATLHWCRVSLLAGVCCRYMQKFARLGNENAVRQLATLAVQLTETLTDLLVEESEKADETAKLVKWWEAENLPYWPMLYFRNTAANNYFPRVADKIGLGEKCYLNVSQKATTACERRSMVLCGSAFDTSRRFTPLSNEVNARRKPSRRRLNRMSSPKSRHHSVAGSSLLA